MLVQLVLLQQVEDYSSNVTGLDRQQVNALIHGIQGVKVIGHGRGAQYVLDE
ncbi:hypothetical protein GMB86_03645 [Terrilactibacillus sp. BCM23-1]|uniref:Uncharacterized protein n=1 Tax=Terrilactibacillus tamarindi TaxID=2599694 RepID=A0A6N8CSX6_9BACI|nr:hypothetical protein [Terrilactibacillus tamarindi]MTT31106.1 hypothetical protein [Terrilactibacillus tamarindi]